MTRDLPAEARAFLNDHAEFSRPLLLAVSGGADSMALLHAFALCRSHTNGLQLAVAHIDHGWRRESKLEACFLQNQVESLGLRWHKKILDPSQIKGNLEDACRLERLRFFHSLSIEFGYQAVLLAHHANDQSETLLKRLFEGAGLSALGGMAPISSWQGLALWRPWLFLPKKELVAWLQENDHPWFEDPTNHDPLWLRGRMRHQLIPYLTELFGKEIASPLASIAREVRESENYIAETLRPVLKRVESGPWGLWADLRDLPLPHPYAFARLMREMASRRGFSLSKQQLQSASKIARLEHGVGNYPSGSGMLLVESPFLLALSKPIPLPLPPKTNIPLQSGLLEGNRWRLDAQLVASSPQRQREVLSSWHDLWRGGTEVYLPANRPYSIGGTGKDAQREKLLRRRNEEGRRRGIPRFLLNTLPLVWHNEEIACDFSQPNTPENLAEACQWKLTLELL